MNSVYHKFKSGALDSVCFLRMNSVNHKCKSSALDSVFFLRILATALNSNVISTAQRLELYCYSL